MASLTADLRERVRALPGMDRLLPALERPAARVPGRRRRARPAARRSGRGPRPGGGGRRAGEPPERWRTGSAARSSSTGASAPPRCGRRTLTFDLAATRRETYPRAGRAARGRAGAAERGPRAPRLHDQRDGALPDRRGLRPPARSRTAGAPTSRPALVRVLHERSFEDDPTRLLRAVRYEARLGFAMDPDTERLARAAAEARRPRHGLGRARRRTSCSTCSPSPRRPRPSSGCARSGSTRARTRRSTPTRCWWPPRRSAPARPGADRALAALAALCVAEPGRAGRLARRRSS